MAYLKEKLIQLEQALEQWKKALRAEYSDLNRDAAIQRFEFTFELFWKIVKIYLQEKEGIACNSPKSCFREIKNIFALTEEEIETCLRMADDRNLSVHTYSEKMAKALYDNLKEYYKISEKIFKSILYNLKRKT